MITEYFNKITELLKKVYESQEDVLDEAAERISQAIQGDGIIHLYGCGHSHILTEEVFYRAGGLVPIHPILHEPLMLHEGAMRSSKLEKKNDYAETFMKYQDIQESDLGFVISTSERNPGPI